MLDAAEQRQQLARGIAGLRRKPQRNSFAGLVEIGDALAGLRT